MCCETEETRRIISPWVCGCGCSFRRFVSKKEEQERLEEYKEQLKNELTGVEERIQELKSK